MVSVYTRFAKYAKLEKTVQTTATVALRFLKKNNLHVGIFLISDAEIQRMNKAYRHKDKPTNVLSFEYRETFVSPSGEKNIGEIYLAPNFIKKHNQSLTHMMVHGLLHVLGYDHVRADDALRMEKKEIDVMRQL